MTGMRSLFVLAMLGAHGAAAAENEAPQVTPALRQRAEDLAGAASQRFTDFLDGGKRQEFAQSGAPQEPTDKPAAAGTFAPRLGLACPLGEDLRRRRDRPAQESRTAGP